MRPHCQRNHCLDSRSTLPNWPVISSTCQRCYCKRLLLVSVRTSTLFHPNCSIYVWVQFFVFIFILWIELQSNYFIENHSHMLSGNHDNATTLRLLYYPPVIQEDDNKCEMAKGRCKYSQQRCNGDKGADLVPPRYVKCDKSDRDDDEDEGTATGQQLHFDHGK